MRASFVFATIVCMHLSSFATGQNSISLKVKKEKLKNVLELIEQQSEYRFLYSDNPVIDNKKVTIKVEKAPLEKVMGQLLEGTGISYKINSNSLVVLSLMKVDPSQFKEITGKVTDEKGQPLANVSVTVKGTDRGTTTDSRGFFSINANTGDELQFSIVGYKATSIKIGSSGVISIKMQVESSSLNEVVVIAYGSETKMSQTSAVSSIKSSEISNIPTAQLSTSLAGRLPGAQIIQNSGFVGSNASISIRGSSANPLYVIDNVVSDKGQFEALDPNQVESISILKDAAAAAIYGARAAGGVVVIKTKSGKPGKVSLSYQGNVSSSRTNLPLQNWTPEQEVVYINNAAMTSNRLSANPNPNFQVPFDANALAYAKTMKSQNINDIIWRNPFAQQHSLNLSGGSDKILYFLSGGYSQNTGSYQRTSFSKYTLQAKVDANLSNNFKLGANLSYNRNFTSRFYWPYDNDNGQGFTVADFYRPTFNLSRLYPFYSKADGTPTTANDPLGYPTIQPGWGFSPTETIRSDNYRHIYYNTFNAIVNGELKIPQVRGLSLKFLADYRQDNFFQKNFIGQLNTSYRVQTVGTSGIGLLQYAPLKFDKGNTVVNNYGLAYTGIYETLNLNERYQLNGFIDYTRSFGAHHITSFVGVEQYQINMKSVNGNASNLLSPTNDQILNANSSNTYRYFNGSEQNQSRLSYFGRAKYDYASKYIMELSFREDGSYIFPKGKQFGFFPSISGAWVASKESFFNVKNISTLKLRASYGTTGYDGLDGTTTNIAPYQYQNNYIVNGSYVFANSTIPGLSPQSVVPNPNITWAVNKTVNAGLDLGLLNDALTFSFDYFNTKRSNILVSSIATVPGTFGSGLPATNIGEQKAHGFEFAANYSNKVGQVSYSVGLNLGYAIEKYVKWPQPANLPAFQNVIGLPTSGVIRGYISEGIVRNQKTISSLPTGYTQFGNPVILGVVLLKDINGDSYAPGANGKIDANDQTIISKNAVPRINIGVPINFKWKQLSISLFFQGVGPYDKYVTTLNSVGAFQIGSRPYFALWTDAYSQDNNPNGKYPLANGGWVEPDLTGCSSTFWRRNGAYMRLKNLNIAYSIPQKIIKTAYFTNFQIYVNATNLFTMTSFKEYDPEQQSLDSYPIFRTFSAGVNLSF
ncbi:MAG: SusC/RagA family TonB-linked outer membrane protein [Bacteroidetes bacterium]|nr:SusC/RagA family TonB-linked outer membrane protein [Bacteroidota bacterium]